jgi:hypothetical protein
MLSVDKNLELVPQKVAELDSAADPKLLAMLDGMVFNAESWTSPSARCCDLVDIA